MRWLARQATLVLITVAAGALLWSPRLAAQPPPQQLYERGAEAYREARYEEALQLLRRAHELDPHPELAYDLGRTHEALGELEHAIERFREYLQLKPDATDRAVVERRVQNLARRMEELRPRVTITSTPSGATIRTGKQVLGKTPFTGSFDAATHTLTVERAGYRPAQQRLRLIEGQTSDVHLQLEPSSLASPETAPDADTRNAAITIPTWVTFGVAAAGLGTSLAFELARRRAERDARDAPTQVEHVSHYDAAKRNRNASRGLLAVGGAAAVAGGALLFFDLRGRF